MSRASLAFAAAWTAGCAALAAFLAWTGLPVWLAILIAFAAGAVFTAGGAAILLAAAAIIEWRQPDGVPEAIRLQLQQAADDIDSALTILCDPCHGGTGRCTCNSRLLCENPDCPAPDTGILTAGDVRWLRSLSISEGEVQ